MNMESAVRESLEVMAGELATPRRRGHHAAMQRGRRRRTVRRLGGVVLGLGVAYGLLLVPAAVTPSIVADGGVTEVAVAMIPASVSGQAPGSEVVWLGEIGPEPQFDTSALGPDLSFEPVDPDVAALEALEGLGAWSERSPDKVVYLGEFDGEPMFLFSVAPPSVLDLVFEYAFGNWSGRIYGTPLNCCGSTADVPPEGLPTFGSWRETIEGGVVESGGYLEWLALPPETSVVSLSAAGIDLGWQRPVGRAAMLPLDKSFLDDNGLVEDPKLVAYAADGTVLASYGENGTPAERDEPAQVLPALGDLSVTHQCNYGFWLGNEDGTIALRLEYDRRAALDAAFPPEEAVALPHPDWDGYLLFGENLYANWCSDTSTDEDPTPVELDRIPVTGGTITWVEAPRDDFAAGPSTISIAGLEVTTSEGEVVVLGDLTITNDNFGLRAN